MIHSDFKWVRVHALRERLLRCAGGLRLEVGNAVRVLVVDALLDGGFEACSVHSGEAAMSTFREGREGCWALLIDVNLGDDGISGRELARQIREIAPVFPVLYMTSASASDWKAQGVDGAS
ncbi:response regulator [Bradyrhizobium sp. BR 1432]|uniref:response regulator n=1 Tax=Bradyrhizobium sp. BR 1432 TaxID=3447966 RepID=UPI003EE7FA63